MGEQLGEAAAAVAAVSGQRLSTTVRALAAAAADAGNVNSAHPQLQPVPAKAHVREASGSNLICTDF